MDKKAEYFMTKIEETIKAGQFSEAKSYYNKACSNIGEIPEISIYKEAIEAGVKKSEPRDSPGKRKPINKNLIIVPLAIVGIVAAIIYYFTNNYPVSHLRKELCHTWYQGDLSSSSSKGVYLEFKNSIDNKYEIWYRTRSGNFIAKFECEIVNGKEITVDGYPIRVEFDGDYVTFSPSFVDTSEKSVWRSNRKYTSSDKTGNFSEDDT